MKKFAEGGEKKKKMLSAAAAVLLLMLISLLFLNSMVSGRDGRTSLMTEEDQVSDEDEAKTAEEIRLENILECISGVGKVSVMIRSSGSESASVFLSDEEKEKEGDVKGVIVAAEGADNPVVQAKITEAVATVCDIPYSGVAVYPMS